MEYKMRYHSYLMIAIMLHDIHKLSSPVVIVYMHIIYIYMRMYMGEPLET